MTPSTTNTAARELPSNDHLRLHLGEMTAQEMRTAKAAYRLALTETLTQQQGGEQEVVDIDAGMMIRACTAYNEVIPLSGFYSQRPLAMRAALTAALRTKQPAASEGDDGDGVANCAECGAFLESVRPGKHQHPTCSQANTSKQAAGEAVAWTTVEQLERVSLGEIGFIARQDMVEPAPNVPLYTTPPRHPADEEAVCAEDLRWLDDIAADLKQAGGSTNNMRLIALNRAIAALQAGTPT